MRCSPPLWARAAALWAAGVLLLGGCSTPPASATSGPPDVRSPGVVIDHVDHHYMEAANFRRISEYFTGVENTTGRIIVRTDPKQRAGYYFIVNLAWHPGTTLPAGTQAELDYIRSDSPGQKHALFIFPKATGTWPEICLGLTGADWPDDQGAIMAYKLTIEDVTGRVLAARQSFLWSLPTQPTAGGATALTAPVKQ